MSTSVADMRDSWTWECHSLTRLRRQNTLMILPLHLFLLRHVYHTELCWDYLPRYSFSPFLSIFGRCFILIAQCLVPVDTRPLQRFFVCFRNHPLLGTSRYGGHYKNILCDHRSATACPSTAPHVDFRKASDCEIHH